MGPIKTPENLQVNALILAQNLQIWVGVMTIKALLILAYRIIQGRLRTWIKKSEADYADNGLAANQAQLIKQQERQIKELQRANEILRKAAAFFAQAELDRK